VIRVVTFDFWNTLLATTKELHERRTGEWIEVLGEAGHDVTEDQMQEAMGRSWQAFVEDWTSNRQHLTPQNVAIVLEHLGVQVDPVVEERLVDAYESDVTVDELAVAPNLAPTLAELKAAGVRLGIICDVAMASGRTLRRNLDMFGVLEPFDHFSFSDEVGIYKPDPAIFAHALEGLGGSPDEAAHVGDLRRTDVAGAKGAGWTAVRYTGLFDEPAAEDGAHDIEADHVIADHAELAGVLGLR
jgi:HAD superfamily hydrolase (TIGR01549 family)